MEYLECLEDCHFHTDSGGERCFTQGTRYQILGGSADNMSGVMLMDDQGDEHAIGTPWVRRFVALNVPLPVAEFFQQVASIESSSKRQRIHEDLLWDTPEETKIFEWTTTAVDEVPTATPSVSWIPTNRIRDDDF